MQYISSGDDIDTCEECGDPINGVTMFWNNGESGDDYEEKVLCIDCYYGDEAMGSDTMERGYWMSDRNEENLEDMGPS